MNNVFRWSGLSLLVALVVTGCSSNSEPALESTSAKAAPATAVAPAATQAKSATSTPDLANPKVTSAQQPAAFAPPFPDRLEIFEPPKRAQTSVKRDDEHGQSVELKGFINVDQPRVVLSIDGVISPVPEGARNTACTSFPSSRQASCCSVGNRWTATLE